MHRNLKGHFRLNEEKRSFQLSYATQNFPMGIKLKHENDKKEISTTSLDYKLESTKKSTSNEF
jgi:hypothetical protein